MNKLYVYGVFLFAVLSIAGCTTSAQHLQNLDNNDTDAVLTSGLGERTSFKNGNYNKGNLINTQKGPHSGLLGKRSYYFAFDSSTVSKLDYQALTVQAGYLLDNENAKIILEGNTDIRGSREYNIALGQRRAYAVANILKMQGVYGKQIKTLSFGAEKPVATGHTEQDYALNRRVDIVYMSI